MSDELVMRHFLHVEDLRLLVYILASITAIVLILGFYRYYVRWRYGGQQIVLKHVTARLMKFVKYSLLQRRVLQETLGGPIHLLIFYGMLVLLTITLIRAFEYDVYLKLRGEPLITGVKYLVYKLVANIAGLMVATGVVIALIRRAFGLTRDLPTRPQDYVVLTLILAIIVTGFLLDGLATASYRLNAIGWWDPVGRLIATVMIDAGIDITHTYRVLWTVHLALSMLGISLIPFTKLSHTLVGGVLNIFLSRLEHPSALKPVPNIDTLIERGEVLGVTKLKHTSWKQRLDYDSCVECSRCHNSCPANLSGKPLSPMRLITSLRDSMRRGEWESELIPIKIKPEIIWSCTTCGSCVVKCPLLIHHVETILDLRRGLFSLGSNIPDELLQVSYNIMRTGNAMGLNPVERENWINKLSRSNLAIIAEEGVEYDLIYWMGCATSYDPSLRTIAESLLKVLSKCGMKVAVLIEERCCGEPARRIGDELMFVECMRSVKELLSKYKFKAILVNCPHCYNVFKHEYPLYGFNVEVIHHVELLHQLVAKGVLKFEKVVKQDVVYHDPCYLSKWNNVISEPREVLSKMKGIKLIELRQHGADSFCCGGGGGHVCAYSRVHPQQRNPRPLHLRRRRILQGLGGGHVVQHGCGSVGRRGHRWVEQVYPWMDRAGEIQDTGGPRGRALHPRQLGGNPRHPRGDTG